MDCLSSREGASVAVKVFLVSPSATTQPVLAKTGNGAIIQGRPEDVGVTRSARRSFATLQTAARLKRILEAFLVMDVRMQKELR